MRQSNGQLHINKGWFVIIRAILGEHQTLIRDLAVLARSVFDSHPAWNMRQRSIDLMNDKDVSALEPLTPNDNRRG